MGDYVVGDIASGIAMCNKCMHALGYRRKDRQAHTALLAHCVGCDTGRPLLSMRHWERAAPERKKIPVNLQQKKARWLQERGDCVRRSTVLAEILEFECGEICVIDEWGRALWTHREVPGDAQEE